MKTGVREKLRLLGDRGHHLGMPVPGIDHRDARREIDEPASIDVPDFRILGFDGVNTLGTHPIRHGGGLAGLEI